MTQGDSTVRLVMGDLTLRSDSSYTWIGRWAADWPSFDFGSGDSVLSAGRYTASGTSVVLLDSRSGGSNRGSFDAKSLTVALSGHEYAFVKQPPVSPVGDWAALFLCTDLQGGSPGCPRTDSTGAEYTERLGNIRIGDSQAGRYDWAHVYRYMNAAGDSTIVNADEFGSYRWDGTTLTMTPDDMARYGAATGTVDGDISLTLQRQNFEYSFVRLIIPFGRIIRKPGARRAESSRPVEEGERGRRACPGAGRTACR